MGPHSAGFSQLKKNGWTMVSSFSRKLEVVPKSNQKLYPYQLYHSYTH